MPATPGARLEPGAVRRRVPRPRLARPRLHQQRARRRPRPAPSTPGGHRRSGYPYLALEDSQANNAYYWFIQPCKSGRPVRPGPEVDRQPVAPRVQEDVARRCTCSRRRRTRWSAAPRSPSSGRTTTSTNQATTYAATGEAGYQSAKQYRIQVVDAADLRDTPRQRARRPAHLHRGRPALPRGAALLAGAGGRRQRQRTRVVDDAHAREAEPAARPAVPGHARVGRCSRGERRGALPLGGAALRGLATRSRSRPTTTPTSPAPTSGSTRRSKRPAFTTGGHRRRNVLAPSDTPYVWRVRRKDPTGNLGPWSPIGGSRSRRASPTCSTPAPDAVVGPRAWCSGGHRCADAASYRVELRKLNSSTTIVTTPASAYAPTTALTVDADLRVARHDDRRATTRPRRLGRVASLHGRRCPQGRRRRVHRGHGRPRHLADSGRPDVERAGRVQHLRVASQRRRDPGRDRCRPHRRRRRRGTPDHRGRHRYVRRVRHGRLDERRCDRQAGLRSGRPLGAGRSPAVARSAPS